MQARERDSRKLLAGGEGGVGEEGVFREEGGGVEVRLGDKLSIKQQMPVVPGLGERKPELTKGNPPSSASKALQAETKGGFY